jgi:CRISPR-associated endonuclease/helicase Cas3
VNLTPDNFADFFSAMHSDTREKRDPFPWQLRLARQVIEEGWPETLSLPTSSGKTSVIDVALFTLALQSGRPQVERTAPLRVFFVVDRRIVVDEVTDHAIRLAQRLRRALRTEDDEPVVREVAARLAHFGGEMRKNVSDDAPLHVATLRGGLYRDDMWTRTPNVPTVCVSTVDQVGSRLLFRGYNMLKEQWPIHAGLVGSDALLIIDEAHLSSPFVETLKNIARYQLQAEKTFGDGGVVKRPLTHPWTVVEMSATPPPSSTPFCLADEDYQDEMLSRRLEASKEAELIEVAENKFDAEVVKHALRLSECEGVKVVGIVVNRVASARRIFERLGGEDDRSSPSQDHDAVLLTGRVRPFDRDRVVAKYIKRMRAGRDRDEPSKKLFVVATQTVEVGANLDFDALVTEAASLSALRQRFGRLDRLGELKTSRAVVVLRKTKAEEDFIYGAELAETWDWLTANASQAEGARLIDFGIAHMRRLFEKGDSTPPPSPLEQALTLFPAYVDSWVQTSPPPHADPDPAPFLHGKEALDTADVQLVWRADIGEKTLTGLSPENKERWQHVEARCVETVTLCPPLTREALPIPIKAARNWLQREGSKKPPEAEVSDVEGRTGAEEGHGQIEIKHVLRWAGPDSSNTKLLTRADEIRPGDTLIVPASYGGADEFGWNPNSKKEVSDIADLCANEVALRTPPRIRGRRKLRLRLHGDVLRNLAETLEVGPITSTEEALAKCLKAVSETGAGDEDELEEAMNSLVAAVKEFFGEHELIAAAATELSKRKIKPVDYPRVEGEPPLGFVLTVAPGARAEEADEFSTVAVETRDDYTNCDDTASLTEVTKNVKLHEHCLGVGKWAREFAGRCGLPEELIRDLEIAGQLHDFGKADPRMQMWLYGGSGLRAAANDYELIAKSKEMAANDKRAMEKAREDAGYPKGTRHEFVSVALMDSASRAFDGVNDYELVRHLVGTHHGYARPFAPVVPDEGIEVSVEDHGGRTLTASSRHGLERLDSGWVEQFWRLVRRYGPWGLAYLEALLRLADYARSGQEQNR